MKHTTKTLTLILILLGIFSQNANAQTSLNHFFLQWYFVNPDGSNERSWEDICLCDNIYIYNNSKYYPNGMNYPWQYIPNTLTGHYNIWRTNASQVLIATIDAADWRHGDIAEIQVCEYFNHDNGLNIVVEYVGSDITGFPSNDNHHLYLKTHGGNNSVSAGPDQTICEGESVQLLGSGANSYNWSPINSTSPTPTVSPTLTTTYQLNGSVQYNTHSTNPVNTITCTYEDDVTVFVNQKPNTPASFQDHLLCTNDPLPILNAGPEGASYTWSFSADGSWVSIVLPENTQYLNTGSYGYGYYTVQIISPEGCMTSKSVHVTLDPSAAVNVNSDFNPTSYSNSTSLTIQGTAVDPVGNHTWIIYNSNSNGDLLTIAGFVFGGSSFSKTGLQLNQYYAVVHYQSKTPCLENSLTKKLIYHGNKIGNPIRRNSVASSTKIDANSAEASKIDSDIENYLNNQVKLKALPNPSNGMFTLQLSGTDNPIEIEVYNLTGAQVDKFTMNTTEKTVDLSNLPKGLYTLSAVINDQRVMQKIIIQ